MKELDSLFNKSSRRIIQYSSATSLVVLVLSLIFNYYKFTHQEKSVVNHIKMVMDYNHITPIEENKFINSLAQTTGNFSFILIGHRNEWREDLLCSRNNCYQLNFSKLFVKTFQPSFLLVILFLSIIGIIFLIQKKFNKLVGSEIETFKKLVNSGLYENIIINTKELESLVTIIRDKQNIDNKLFLSRELAHDMQAPIEALNYVLDNPTSEKKILKDTLNRLVTLNEKIIKNEYSEEESLVDLNDLINEVIDEIKITFSFVEIKLNSESKLKALLRRSDFYRSLINLFKNSIEANKGEVPQIDITISKNENTVTIKIEDNGPGFPEEVIKSFGIKECSIDKVDGHGIGLLQVYRGIESSNGKIEISNSERGAYVVIKIDYIKNYILIDDDELIHLTWSSSAKKAGIKLSCFYSIEDFLSAEDFCEKNTVFYVDSNLKGGLKGEVEAKKLLDVGYFNINITTGFEKNEIEKPLYVREIIGKKPPF
jgi:signal transduction histidine kinase